MQSTMVYAEIVAWHTLNMTVHKDNKYTLLDYQVSGERCDSDTTQSIAQPVVVIISAYYPQILRKSRVWVFGEDGFELVCVFIVIGLE